MMAFAVPCITSHHIASHHIACRITSHVASQITCRISNHMTSHHITLHYTHVFEQALHQRHAQLVTKSPPSEPSPPGARRSSAPYIAMFRGASVVFHLPGSLLDEETQRARPVRELRSRKTSPTCLSVSVSASICPSSHLTCMTSGTFDRTVPGVPCCIVLAIWAWTKHMLSTTNHIHQAYRYMFMCIFMLTDMHSVKHSIL